ncbi:MAG: hypothetical protein GY816_07330, partial [Cytophagales bacterium]|nr:hypothetical protein [Cytophagales bacterium]
KAEIGGSDRTGVVKDGRTAGGTDRSTGDGMGHRRRRDLIGGGMVFGVVPIFQATHSGVPMRRFFKKRAIQLIPFPKFSI